MRVCLLSTAYPPASTEGIARQRQLLATELARLGHDVHVVTLGAAMSVREEDGVRIHEVLVGRINRFSRKHPALDVPLTCSQALYEGLMQQSSDRPFDIVDVPLWSSQGFVTLYRYQGPTVLWLQTTLAQLLAIHRRRPSADQRVLLTLDRVCLERATGLLADSYAALESIFRDYRVTRNDLMGVAYLGLPPSADRDAICPARSVVEALIVGRLEWRKGTPLLFDTLPELLRRHPKLVVRFVGRDNSAEDGWQRQHHASYSEFFQCHYPELAQRAIFEGYVDEVRLGQCYRGADFLLAPSLYESFGLFYLEGMRAGLPVVAFAAGAAKEIFASGEDDGALLVPPGDIAGLSTAVSRLIEQRDLRRRLGERGRTRFESVFSAEAMARATLSFYERVLARSDAFFTTPDFVSAR
ncbi:MAG TPA: glycosyltransferase family 4 protein [Anaerolineae bacterium]|nr:glycosyltransferase family 4 protein [Anaerolineae bacterium]